MKRNIIQSALIAAALLMSASLSVAVDIKSGTAAEAKTPSGAKTTEKNANAAKTAANIKLVDINSASKAELKKLPGISDAEADKIIAGRPYLTKAHLVTHNIISRGAYENLKTLVIAKQKQEPAAKPGQK